MTSLHDQALHDALEFWETMPAGVELPQKVVVALLAARYITRSRKDEPWVLTKRGRDAIRYLKRDDVR